jgi:plastocyanin
VRTRAAASVVLLSIGAVLSSCATEQPARKPETHTIVMEGVAFQPASLTLAIGDSVVWVNKDPFPHTATSKGIFDSKEISVGKSWQFTPSAAGELAYVCAYHPTMKGVLRVMAAGDERR